VTPERHQCGLGANLCAPASHNDSPQPLSRSTVFASAEFRSEVCTPLPAGKDLSTEVTSLSLQSLAISRTNLHAVEDQRVLRSSRGGNGIMDSLTAHVRKAAGGTVAGANRQTQQIPLLAVLLLVTLTLSGCITSGALFSTNLTNVELGEDNFKIVATNVHGESEAGYLLGISGSQGGYATTFALLRVEGDGLLYKAAVENLWAHFEEQYGPVENRRLALVNVQFDADASNYLGLYTKSMVAVRADVVEFGQ
jgi:hypothetical protein